MHIYVTGAFQKCMNHSCAVIGMAANVGDNSTILAKESKTRPGMHI